MMCEYRQEDLLYTITLPLCPFIRQPLSKFTLRPSGQYQLKKCIIVVILFSCHFTSMSVPENLENVPALVLTQLPHS